LVFEALSSIIFLEVRLEFEDAAANPERGRGKRCGAFRIKGEREAGAGSRERSASRGQDNTWNTTSASSAYFMHILFGFNDLGLTIDYLLIPLAPDYLDGKTEWGVQREDAANGTLAMGLKTS